MRTILSAARTLGALLLSCSIFAVGAQAALINTITVNTTSDEFGSGASCSLREAVQSANTDADFGGCTHSGTYGINDKVSMPAGGFFSLTRIGIDEDANSTSDIDITDDLAVQGNGSVTTSIGNLSGTYSGRIIHVLNGATVTLSGVTLRDGSVPTGRAGGGLRTEPGTHVTLNDTRVVFNDANGNAGGILNRGTMTLNNSLVDQNKVLNGFEGGGGIFNDDNATLTLNDSRVLDNRTEGNGANGSGAGIYSDAGATLTLNDSTVDGNTVAIGGVVDADVIGDGGGIYNLGQLTLVRSTVSNNVAAGNNAKGGGIRCANGSLTLDRSLVAFNSAEPNPDISVDSPHGGGIDRDTLCDSLLITDSIISGNHSRDYGGGIASVGTIRIVRSLIINNTTDGEGGGVNASLNDTSRMEIVNSSIDSNDAGDGGGGIQVETNDNSAVVLIRNSTIVGNAANTQVGDRFGIDGGGIRLYAVFEFNTVKLQNTVIAGNSVQGLGVGPDCSGAMQSFGYNLIGNTSDCNLSGFGPDDFTNVSAGLAAASNNGGLVVGASNGLTAGMLTRAPLSNSMLIDAGDPSGCRDADDSVLATDQIGRTRALDGPDVDIVATCDIGAVEFAADPIFADDFE